jgi:uncharacterized protein
VILRMNQTAWLFYNITHDGFMTDHSLLQQIKAQVHQMEPNAEIIFYGSRARGDAEPDSDWDFIILVDGVVTDERVDTLRHHLYELEWETGEVLSCIVRSHKDWQTSLYQATSLYQNAQREGVRL